MSKTQYTEDNLVQQTTADYLLHDLKWDESFYGLHERLGKEGDLGRESERDVILSRYLSQAIVELNPNLPAEAHKAALKTIIQQSTSKDITGTNRDNYKLHLNGVEVSFRDQQGNLTRKKVRLFDFEDYDNNHFLLVREFWVQGEVERKRADLVGFVNGIPLVFMEFKNLSKNIRAAYEVNLAEYKRVIPHLFHHNALIILGNGIDAKIGSVSSKFEHFNDWKRLDEDDPGVVDMETLLKGTCSRFDLMNLFENYILFDDSSGSVKKILARNHQYLGVNRAIESVKNRSERAGKLGVFWHTQGSGKSYSIVFFSRMVHRKLGGNFTFLVLTDRLDLDTQIYKTFAGCGVTNHDQEPCRTSGHTSLQAMLGQQKSYIFSLIQRFNERVGSNQAYSERDDIIVITDEAHRSQYGDLALNMRNALPNASYIGFTGTPLFKNNEITKEYFGDYVSTYDFQRAVDDNATVPLYYDSRGENLVFIDQVSNQEYSVADPAGINERVAEKLAEFEIDDIDVQARLEQALKRNYHILTATSRLDQIAQDFAEHYATSWENGKAMLVCLDKLTCVRMYQLIQPHWQEQIKQVRKQLKKASDEQEQIWLERKLNWMEKTLFRVVVSEEQGEYEKFEKWGKGLGKQIDSHRKALKKGFEVAGQKQTLDIETAFKDDDHPFRVAIVCSMWLTGFDVPSLSTLYLDKPLKDHTLMQAIARANRVAEGKNNGLIVDYCGILKNLRQALATFAGVQDTGHVQDPTGSEHELNPANPYEDLLGELKEAIAIVDEFFRAHKFKLSRIILAQGFGRNGAIADAKEIINENDETRKRFEIMARQVFIKFKACINLPEINDYREKRDVINIVYKSLQADKDKADISALMRQLHETVDDHIDIVKSAHKDFRQPYDISAIDFERLRQEFVQHKQKNTLTQSLKQVIEKRLQHMMEQNPLRTDFQAHYEKLIIDYNSERKQQTIEQTFDALLKLYDGLDQEDKRAAREGMTEETLAIFDLLNKPDLDKKSIKTIKAVAHRLLDRLKHSQLKMDNWREKEASRDAVKKSIHDFLYADDTGLPVESFDENEVQAASDKVFIHIYRAYPYLPSPVYRTEDDTRR